MSLSAELEHLFDEATGDVALGELGAAVEKFRRCTKLDPGHFESWHALGMALMKSGLIEEAVAAGLRAVELRPNDQLAWSSLSLFYVRQGKQREAEAAALKARIISWGGDIRKAQLDQPPTPPSAQASMSQE